MTAYNARKDAYDSYLLAVDAKRERGDTSWPEPRWKRREVIGDCTLYLGDSLEIVPGLVFDSLLTDPPFGMAFQSNYRGVKHEKIAGDRETDLLKWACGLPVKHSRYVFCRWDNLRDIPNPKSLVTWVKNNWSMGDLDHEHARQTEVCAFYAGDEHYFPAGRPSDVVNCARSGNEHHPTEKPISLMSWFVRHTSGIVLDPFMGAGSTGIASAKYGRQFIGIELHEPYFDIACDRIRKAYAQPDMFVLQEKRLQPTQEALL